MGLGGSFSTGGSTVTALSLLEESRCPADVQCIQAGTVRLLARVSNRGQVATIPVGLRSPADIGGRWLHLVGACPYPSLSSPITRSAYRFTFLVDDSSASREQPSSCGSR
jgi:hypothetical protein